MVVLVRNELTLNEISDSARSQVKKNRGFSAVFREYEIRALATKGLKSACLFIHGISIFKITCSNSIAEHLRKKLLWNLFLLYAFLP